MILTTPTVLAQVIAHCQQEWPQEACGLLLGSPNGGDVHVSAAEPLRNLSRDPRRHFLADPEAWIAFLYADRTEARSLVGLYHSHPTEPAVPSARDADSLWTFPAYWIVSLRNRDTPEVKGYRLEGASGQQKSPLGFREHSIRLIAD
ncbi:M67 family metallopeptidase [Paenibacillus sp. CC-CFT747]|nr:M67 family metallopeptidase [Paenibacillus sp. CC-CFT747]